MQRAAAFEIISTVSYVIAFSLYTKPYSEHGLSETYSWFWNHYFVPFARVPRASVIHSTTTFLPQGNVFSTCFLFMIYVYASIKPKVTVVYEGLEVTSSRLRWGASFTPRPVYFVGNFAPCPLNKRFCGFGHYVEEKSLLSLQGTEPRFLGCLVCILVTTTMESFRLILSLETDCTGWGISWCLSVSPGKLRQCVLANWRLLSRTFKLLLH